jgi:YVTN family beta-propeller protein
MNFASEEKESSVRTRVAVVALAAAVIAVLSGLPLRAGTAVSPPSTARLLVLNKTDATMVTVDPATGQVVGRVATGDGPHEVDTDGTHAFVGNYGGQTPGSSLSIIDLATQKEIKRVDLGPMRRPHGLALSGGKLYFTAETNCLVARYDPSSGHFDWVLGTGQAGTHMVWVHPSGSPIVTTNLGSDTVTVMEPGTNPAVWSLTQIPTGKGPEGFDVSPDGTELWAAHSRDGAVSIIDLARKKVIQTLDLKTKRSNRLKFTPDGRMVLISDLDAGELVVVDAKSRAAVKRLSLGRSPEGILVVPDGSRAYVAVTGDNLVAVVDLKTLDVTARIATGTGPDGMAWVR